MNCNTTDVPKTLTMEEFSLRIQKYERDLCGYPLLEQKSRLAGDALLAGLICDFISDVENPMSFH